MAHRHTSQPGRESYDPGGRHDHGHSHGPHRSQHHEHDHEHDHEHGAHSHNHAVVGDLRIALGINVVFTVVEFVGGLMTNSVAIISDAVHDLGDSVTLAIALAMERVAGRGRTRVQTFGYRRFSTLGALLTGMILVVGAITVLVHAVPRIVRPEAVDSGGMVILAVIGVAMNALAALRLSRTESMNARAAFLHLLEDVLGWVAVLLGGIAIRIWNATWIDPVLSVAINLFVLSRAVPVLWRALRVLLQYVPGDLSVSTLEDAVSAIDGVRDVHDLHVWTLDGTYTLFSAHIVTDGEQTLEALEALKRRVRASLAEVGIDHVTIELEAAGAGCHDCDL